MGSPVGQLPVAAVTACGPVSELLVMLVCFGSQPHPSSLHLPLPMGLSLPASPCPDSPLLVSEAVAGAGPSLLLEDPLTA